MEEVEPYTFDKPQIILFKGEGVLDGLPPPFLLYGASEGGRLLITVKFGGTLVFSSFYVYLCNTVYTKLLT